MVACGDSSDTSGSGGGGSGGSSSTSTASNMASSSSASGSVSSSSGGAVAPELKVLVNFNASMSELPEGVAVTADGTTAYVGFAPTGKIVKVTLPDGQRSDFGAVTPALTMGELLLGLTLDEQGTLFAAVTGKVKGTIYQFDASGVPTVVVQSNAFTFPNGLVFAKDGSLLVTDSAAGAVFKVDVANKMFTEWVPANPLLTGDPAATNPCAKDLPTEPRGANGIAIVGDNAYVANVQNATVVKIPINADGTAGMPVEFAKGDATCAPLQGVDGIAADTDGSLLYVGNTGNTVGRIGADGTAQSLVTGGDLLDFPASISIATVNGEKYAILTNFAILDTLKPGLLTYGPLK